MDWGDGEADGSDGARAAIGLSQLTSDFVALVAERGRTDHLEVIAEKYQKLLDEDRGRVRAHLRTAVPLTDEERAVVSARLGPALGARQVVLDEVVDRSMLGGFIVESGTILVDGSLEAQLERMRRRLGSGEAGASDQTEMPKRPSMAPSTSGLTGSASPSVATNESARPDLLGMTCTPCI